MAGKKESKSKAKGKNQKKKQKVDRINCIFAFLQNKKNIILQGAPGTGKTYKTAELALAIVGCLPKRGKRVTENVYHKKVMEEYGKRLVKFDDKGKIIGDGQIGFVTFHQSMDYEDFVEGIKPLISKTDNETETKADNKADTKAISYDIVPGIFKEIVNNVAINKEFEQKWNALLQKAQSKEICIETTRTNVTIRANRGSLKYKLKDKQKWENVSKNQIKKVWNEFWDKNLDDITNFSNVCPTGGDQTHQKAILKELKDIKLKDSELEKSNGSENYVLIIDEINRGNVSKIFGELISLLEADKRAGGDHPLTVTLPYSKEQFSVPSNLYIIGTMNTTDRSVGSIDYAVRRRFAFVTLPADEKLVLDDDARNLFNAVKNFLDKSKYDMEIDDLMVGHSYFMDADNLQMKWQYEILPLLMEYHKDGIISKSPLKDSADKEIADVKKNYANFITAWEKPNSETSNS